MNALLMLAVLGTGQVSQGDQAWLDDYGIALAQAKTQNRPLLVVIQAGSRFRQISVQKTAKPGPATQGYVLCHIDGGSDYGKRVATAFNATSLPHTAIIDKTGSTILYTKQGSMSNTQWSATLATYRAGVQPVAYQSYQEPAAEQSYGGSYSGSVGASYSGSYSVGGGYSGGYYGGGGSFGLGGGFSFGGGGFGFGGGRAGC